MDTTEECLVVYRHALRQLLAFKGVRSNPAVQDEWILDQIAAQLGQSIDWQDCRYCNCKFPGAVSLGLHVKKVHPEYDVARFAGETEQDPAS
jgi:hypothetical protein